MKSLFFLLALLLAGCVSRGPESESRSWRVGMAQTNITPAQLLWMGGFASRTQPAEGKLDDLFAKVLVLEAPDGEISVLVTLDLVGVPKWLYENLHRELARRHGLTRAQIRFAASHTHSGPVLRDALQDIYPWDDAQRRLSADYSAWLEPVLADVVSAALAHRVPATLWAGEGRATFAVNRRTNDESKLADMLARGEAPKGPSDFAVPVLVIRSPDGRLLTTVFGYAAHTSCLTRNQLWSADYCGVSMRAIEAKYPGAMAMFWQGCGSDQSAAPRGTVELCRQRGQDLAVAVETVLGRPMRSLAPQLKTAFEFVSLDFGEQPTADELARLGTGTDYRARWARRLSGELASGKAFATAYPEYPVQVWRLGTDQLWIGLGGEVCVDYALRFKREYGAGTWINGYANDVMAYIPSRRLREEGGYQAGAFDVYGLPANRWCPDIEDRIAGAVARLVRRVGHANPAPRKPRRRHARGRSFLAVRRDPRRPRAASRCGAPNGSPPGLPSPERGPRAKDVQRRPIPSRLPGLVSALGLALFMLAMERISPAADAPPVVQLWPDRPPDEGGFRRTERTRLSPKLDRSQVEVTNQTQLVTDVTAPTLTIRRPTKDLDVGTALLICPGGGYWDLYWQLEGEEVADWANSLGMTGIILKYRVPRRPDEPQGLPARRPLQDAQRAVSLVRSRARDWGIAPDRIGIVGFSAGGHLAIASATQFEKRTYAAVDSIDDASCRPDFAISVYPGYLKAKDKDELAEGIRVPTNTPPVFLTHGGADLISAPEHSVLMYLSLRKAGVPAELHVYGRAAHDFGVRPNDNPCGTWTNACAAWLRHEGFLPLRHPTDH